MKKSLSLLLAMMLVLSLGCLSVSAATVEADDFEGSTRIASFVDLNSSTTIGDESIVTDGTNNHALKFKTDAAFARWGFHFDDEVDAGNFTEISYDIMFDSFPTNVYGWDSNNVPDPTNVLTGDQVLVKFGGAWFSWDTPASLEIMRQSDGTVCLARNQAAIADTELSEDTWYTIKWLRAGGQSASIFLAFTEADGTVLWSMNIGALPSWAGGNYCLAMGTPYGGVCSDATLLIDNLSKKSYPMTSGTVNMADANVADGATEVPLNQEMSFGFDRLLDASSVVSITDSNGDPVTNSLGAPITVTQRVLGNRIVVSFSDLLCRNETYTVDFSGVIDTGSAACGTTGFTFTTEDVHFQNAPTISGVEEIGGDTKITFILNDPYEYPTFSGIFAAAGYDANSSMIAFDLVSVNAVPIGTETNATFDFGLTGVTKVKLMAFDYANGFVPLAVGEIALP